MMVLMRIGLLVSMVALLFLVAGSSEKRIGFPPSMMLCPTAANPAPECKPFGWNYDQSLWVATSADYFSSSR